MPIELFEMLKHDHDEFMSMLEELGRTSDQATESRESRLGDFADELIPHLRGEEQAFYPALRRIDETRELALEALEEHHAAETTLSELSDLASDAESWSAKLRMLREILEHHIEEEDKVFDRAEEVLDESQLDNIMRRIQSIKEEMKAAVS